MRVLRILLLAGLVLARAAAGEEIRGTVVKVFDGDSFIVALAQGERVEVRLAGIDAPEKNQPYADSARAALRGMVLDQKLRLEVLDIDRYGRKVVRAFRVSDRMDVNAELVRRGHAWVYRRHAYDESLYDLERDARERKVGLWALPEAEREPPWRWRREHPPEHRPAGAGQKTPSPAASMSR